MALPQAGVELVANGLSGFTADMGRANDAVAAFGKSGGSAGGAFDKGFSEIVIGGLRKIGELGVEALLKAGQAVGQFIGDSISLAGDFEAGMLEFQAVAGKDIDTKGLEEFRDLFIDIGKRLPVSTSEVQDAAIELIKGGIEPATVAAGGLESSIKFAAAAMDGDLAGAAEISAKIVGGWAEVNATAAEKAALLASSQDLLTKAANASTVGVQDLSLGLFNVQGNAKLAGIGLDETVTALSLISPNFSNAATAGTSLNALIARLQPSTKPAIAAMQGLGLYTEEAGSAFYDAQGNFVGWAEVSQLLQDATIGLTDAQKQSIFQTVFGMDAMGAAAELTRQGADGYNQMVAALEKANGVAENAALKQQGFNTALENAKGSVEAMQITVGSFLLPVLADLLNNYISPAINIMTDFADAVFGSDEAFSRLSPELQIIVTVIDELVLSVGGIIDAFNDAGAGSIEFAEALGGLADDLGLPGDLIQDLIRGVQEVVSWFDQGGAASDELGGAVDDLSGVWKKAGDVVDNVLDAYKDIIDSVLPQVQQFVDEHGDEISAFFKAAWDSIIEIIGLALDLYNEIVPPVLHAIADFIDDHGSEIQRILKAAWDTISTLIGGALELIKGVITTTLALIRGDWDGAWEGIEGITKTITSTIGGVVEGFLNIIAGFFDTSLDEIVNLWQNNWDMLVDIAMSIGDRMIEAGASIIEGILEGLRSNAGGVIDFLIQLAKDAVAAFFAAIDGGSPAMEFAPAGASVIEGIMKGMSDMWPALMKLVEGLGDDLIQRAADLGMAVQGAIGDAFSSTATIDRQIAKNLDDVARNVSPDYQQFTQGALKAAEDEARRFLDPTEGAKFFQMRSKQILEFAKLQQDLAEETDSVERERIRQKMNLINAAQTAEINAFNANLNASQSGTEQLMENIQALLSAEGVPGVLDSPAVAALDGLLRQLSNYSPYSGYVNPPMSAQQQYGAQTSYSRTTTLNMPIYTNQSPSVMQDSAAIAWAVMP